jgi:hypothetical protein
LRGVLRQPVEQVLLENIQFLLFGHIGPPFLFQRLEFRHLDGCREGLAGLLAYRPNAAGVPRLALGDGVQPFVGLLLHEPVGRLADQIVPELGATQEPVLLRPDVAQIPPGIGNLEHLAGIHRTGQVRLGGGNHRRVISQDH